MRRLIFPLLSATVIGMSVAASMASAQSFRSSPSTSSIIPPPPTPAGTCAAAAEGIINGPGTFNGNSCSGTTNISDYANAVCNTVAYPGPEEFWQVEVGANISATLLLTPASADMGIFLVSQCGSGTSCVAFHDSIGDGAPSGLAIGTTAPDASYSEYPASSAPAGTYYAYVDSYYASGTSSCSDYSLTVGGTLPVELTNFSVD